MIMIKQPGNESSCFTESPPILCSNACRRGCPPFGHVGVNGMSEDNRAVLPCRILRADGLRADGLRASPRKTAPRRRTRFRAHGRGTQSGSLRAPVPSAYERALLRPWAGEL